MQLRSVTELEKNDLKGKLVLLRLDLDLPLGADGVVAPGEDTRLLAGLATVKFLLKNEAHVVIVGHLGRPPGQVVQTLKLKPVVSRLTQLLGATTGMSTEKLSYFDSYMFLHKRRKVHVLENIRFQPGEQLNTPALARDLAGLADLYVNDAFAVAHRDHASIAGVTRYLPSYAGLNLAKEVAVLGQVLERPARPLTLIIGGVKAQTKLQLVEKFIPRADFILLGSAVANNFFKELGYKIGKSVYDNSLQDIVRSILARPAYRIFGDDPSPIMLDPYSDNLINTINLQRLKKRIILPVDSVAAPFDLVKKGTTKLNTETVTIDPIKKKTVKPDNAILDIGPLTIRLYGEIIKRSKTIIWNGPMGYFENHPFDLGTYEVARAVAGSRGKGIIGGGDTIAAINSEHVKFRQNVFISTGGGAMLEFLLDPNLPGIKPLIKK